LWGRKTTKSPETGENNPNFIKEPYIWNCGGVEGRMGIVEEEDIWDDEQDLEEEEEEEG